MSEAKLNKLVEALGEDSAEAALDQYAGECFSKGICMSDNCDHVQPVLPEVKNALCAECETFSVRGLDVLYSEVK